MVRNRFPATPQDRMNAILRYVCDQQIHVVMEFGSRLDEKVLERSVHQLLRMEPALGWRWVERTNAHWRMRENLDSLPSFMLVSSGAVYDELEVFIVSPSDPGADPLLQVRLFRGGTDLLCLKINHVVCDGMGAKEVAYELAHIYTKMLRGEITEKKPDRPRDRSMRYIWREFPFEERWRLRQKALQAIRRPNVTSTQWCFPFSSRETKGRRILIKRFEAERSKRISSYCKEMQVTVNDIFLGAFVGSLFEINKPKEGVPVPVQVAFDLRKLSPDREDNVTNLGGALFPRFTRREGADNAAILHDVHSTMTTLKERGDAAVSIPFIEMAYGFLPFGMTKNKVQDNYDSMVKRRSIPPLFSNVGILDTGRMDLGGASPLNAFLTIPIAFPPLLMLGLSSYRGIFTLSVGYCSYGVEMKDMDKLFDFIDARLPQ
jgi:NRPS condensation-like uncharacterized protein